MKATLPYLAAVAAWLIARAASPDTPAPPAADEAGAATKSNPVAVTPMERRIARLEMISTAGPSALRKLHAKGLRPDDLRDLVARSAELDPEGTWNFIHEARLDQSLLGELRQQVAVAWFVRNPEALLSRLDPTDSGDWDIGKALVNGLGSEDLVFARHARDHFGDLMRLMPTGWLQGMFLPPDSESAITSLPDSPAKFALMKQFAVQALTSNFETGLAAAKKLPPHLADQAIESALTSLLNPHQTPTAAQASARKWLGTQTDPGLRAKLGPLLVEAMAKEDPVAAYQWAATNLQSGTLSAATGKIIAAIQKEDPAKAREWVDDLSPGYGRDNTASAVAATWARDAPAEAGEWWLERIGARKAAEYPYSMTGRDIGNGWLKKNPDELRARAADPEKAPLPASLLQPALAAWTESDPAGTWQWVTSQPEDRRSSMTGAMLAEWATRDPEAAAVAWEMNPTAAPPSSAGALARKWYDRDPEAVVTWANQLPAGDMKNEAVKQLRSIGQFEVDLGGAIPPALKKLTD